MVDDTYSPSDTNRWKLCYWTVITAVLLVTLPDWAVMFVLVEVVTVFATARPELSIYGATETVIKFQKRTFFPLLQTLNELSV